MNPFSSDIMLQFPGEFWTLLGVVFAFLLLAVLAPIRCVNAEQAIGRLFSRLARRKTPLIWVLFFAVIGVRLAVLPLLPVPVPGIHDEFSYLLLGDTLAHGRLTNPPHPMWMSFESFHINWFPTYCSKYPPGQGAVLALGELLGLPWIGVILSVAAMCAVMLWMLQAWLPPKWALLGAALVAVKFGIANYWMNSYWGGAVAATGGALVLGAMRRMVRQARIGDALLLGLGLAVLANTRPYEGFVFSAPVGVWFFWWLAGKTKSTAIRRIRMTRGLAPLAVVLVLTLGFMGYYNWRLTGNAFLLPHVLNTRTYRTAGLFLWDHAKPPMHYHNRQFEDFYNGWERENYKNAWPDLWRVSKEKLTRCGGTYFWWGALLLLPGLPFAVLDRKMRLPVLLFLLGAAGFFVLIWSMPHYAAPTTGVIFLLSVQAIRHLRTMRLSGRPLGVVLSGAAVCLLAVEVGFQAANHSCDSLDWRCRGDPSRAAIQEKLSHTPGKHLILVRYGEHHNIHDEWVYNGAEIDSAKVLWARELDGVQNARLFAYFKDRHVWLVEPDKDNTELIPYTPPPGP